MMFDPEYPTRIVNLRYTVNGLRFDAAIDCNWQLHCYEEDPLTMRNQVPIELYCFDHPEWDIRMLYQNLKNDQGIQYMQHTEVDLEGIIKETEKWIEEEIGKPIKPENNEENIMPLF